MTTDKLRPLLGRLIWINFGYGVYRARLSAVGPEQAVCLPLDYPWDGERAVAISDSNFIAEVSDET